MPRVPSDKIPLLHTLCYSDRLLDTAEALRLQDHLLKLSGADLYGAVRLGSVKDEAVFTRDISTRVEFSPG